MNTCELHLHPMQNPSWHSVVLTASVHGCLLGSWAMSMIGCRQGAGAGVAGRAAEAVGAVFQALLEAALRDAAAGAFEDEEDDQGSGINCSTPPIPFIGALPSLV